MDLCEWRTLNDLPYAVSSKGLVKRIKPGGNNTFVGKILTPTIWESGRKMYKLHYKGKCIFISAARCVALAFIGPPPTLRHDAAHDDGDCTNDVVSNIKWKTHKENLKDSVRHGTCKTKLTPKDVLLMRKLKKEGSTFSHIATMFPQVNYMTVYLAVKRITWQHI